MVEGSAPADGPGAASALPYECDLILKGGTTSGVVYPPAIVEIAKDHRLRSIGGASAGAIAAAGAAAAELGRDSQTGGFERLARVAGELAEEDAGGRTRLRRLFQPQPETRPLFDLIWTIRSRDARGRLRRLLHAFDRRGPEPTGWMAIAFWIWLAVVALAVAAVASAGAGALLTSIPLVLLATALCALVAPAGRVILAARALPDETRAILEANFHGLCDGRTAEGADDAGLTDWLHDLLQELAGRTAAGPPVTYGDLARAEIELVTITTDVSSGTCERFPLRTRDWAFREKDMRRLLPDDVAQHLVDHRRTTTDAQMQAAADEQGLMLLPEPGDLPILLGARISLSFPVLLSAVPLYAYRPMRDGDGWTMCFQRCWFSDGGITSNLPVHLFDRPLPSRPTYSLNLVGGGEPDAPPAENVWRAIETGDGAQAAIRGIEQTEEFVARIVNTTQSWADNTLARAAGQRDRICVIRLARGEGGLNLDMPPSRIRALAERGEAAGRNLAWIQRGETPSDYAGKEIKPEISERQWDRHRFARYRVFLAGLGRYLEEVRGVDIEPYGRLADRAVTESWLPYRGKDWTWKRRALVEEAQLQLFAIGTDALVSTPPTGAALGPSVHPKPGPDEA